MSDSAIHEEWRVITEGAHRFAEAMESFCIAVVDEVTPILERLIVALQPLSEWCETERIINGLLEPFGFREVEPL